MILAYETATDVCSVSFLDNSGEIFEKRIQGRSVHSDNLFLFTSKLMSEHSFQMKDVKAVLVSNGPGSYTGLRIAASAIKGILFGLDTPLFEVNTLAGFAKGVSGIGESTRIHAVIDARRTHVYHQLFSTEGGFSSVSQLMIKEIAEVESEFKTGEILIGTGINRFSKSSLSEVKTFDSEFISASNLIRLFEEETSNAFCKKVSVEELNPNYITSNQVNNSAS